MNRLERALNAGLDIAGIINSEGHNAGPIYECIRNIRRQMQIDGARTISELPDIPILQKISRTPMQFSPEFWAEVQAEKARLT